MDFCHAFVYLGAIQFTILNASFLGRIISSSLKREQIVPVRCGPSCYQKRWCRRLIH